MPIYDNELPLYDYKPTGIIDKLVLRNNNPLDAWFGDTKLTAKDMGDYYAYSDGSHQWTYPKSKLEDTSNLNAQQRLERDWRKSPAYGFDKVMLGTLGLGAAPFFAMEAAPTLVGLANVASDAAMATRAGQAVYQGLTSPVGKAALSSVFGGMGMHNFFSDNGYAKTLQEWNNLKNDPNFYNAVNFGKSALGDAMDVTMMAPMGKVFTGLKNYNAYKQVKAANKAAEAIPHAYNRNPQMKEIGSIEDYTDYLNTVFPESKVKDIHYHVGPKGIEKLKPSTGEIWNTNQQARGIYTSPDKGYPEGLRKYTTDRIEKVPWWKNILRNITPGGWDKANEMYTEIYPVMLDIRNPLNTKGAWTWGMGDKKARKVFSEYDGIINKGPRWWENVNSMPETIVPNSKQTLILGSEEDLKGFSNYIANKKTTRAYGGPLSNTPLQEPLQPLNEETLMKEVPSEELQQSNIYKQWNDLSLKERAEMMRVAIRNGITNLSDIRDKYNEFALGGNIYDGVKMHTQQMNQQANPKNIYDVLPLLFAKDGVKIKVTSGYRPNAVVQEGGKSTGRRSRHSIWGGAADIVAIDGSNFADIRRVLDDPNSNTSRWLIANGYGYLDETSATGTTKYWHDHNRDHSHYHIGKDYGNRYASLLKSAPAQIQQSGNNYIDIAKDHIRKNESFFAKSYADAPAGKNWRSVGYGFNDSGFWSKYPNGISKYYDARGGITKEEAERELDWMLRTQMIPTLEKVYGDRWSQFNDNQKAAIIDTMYQRPASVLRDSAFYNAIMANSPNAVDYLGVKSYDRRNADRRNLYTMDAMEAPNGGYSSEQYQMAYNPFMGYQVSNPRAFYGNPEDYQQDYAKLYSQQEVPQPLVDAAFKYSEEEQRKAERQRQMANFRTLLGMTGAFDDEGLLGGVPLLTGGLFS